MLANNSFGNRNAVEEFGGVLRITSIIRPPVDPVTKTDCFAGSGHVHVERT